MDMSMCVDFVNWLTTYFVTYVRKKMFYVTHKRGFKILNLIFSKGYNQRNITLSPLNSFFNPLF